MIIFLEFLFILLLGFIKNQFVNVSLLKLRLNDLDKQ